jgi:general secretion pathway protein D
MKKRGFGAAAPAIFFIMAAVIVLRAAPSAGQGTSEGIPAPGQAGGQWGAGGQALGEDPEKTQRPHTAEEPGPKVPARAKEPVRPSMPAAKAAEPDDGLMSLDFSDVDIKQFIKAMSDVTGRNIVVDEQVKGKVTIISPKRVNPKEALKVFESTLGVYGYALVESGEVTKVVPAMEAKQMGPFRGGASVLGDKVVTRLIPLKFAQGDMLISVIRPLLPVTSYITFHQETNTVIIVDYASNVEKLLGIIERLDVPGQEEVITVRRLTYAGAKEMADRINQLFSKGGLSKRNIVSPYQPGTSSAPAPGPGSAAGMFVEPKSQTEAQVIADERINAVVIVASKPMTEKLLGLVENLDQAAPAGQGRINVYYLKNADAEEMAKVLTNMVSGSQPPGQTRPVGMAPAPPMPPGMVGSMTLQGAITVTPDKATNSLVITASKEDFTTLKQVIEALDKRRRQVFVEALIMEITTDKQRQFGIEWRTTSDFTKKGLQGIGGTNFGNINAVAENPLNAPQGLAVGVVDGIISFGGKDFLNLGGLLHALQTETGVNILSTPNILTTDNEKAEIVVAQNVPFVTGQSQNTGGTTLTTIERRNIGITLRIKPQISESDAVKLSVYQEISSISPTQLDKAKDLITFTRSVDTTVVVSDGQNVVIGGLIRDDLNDVENKVPLLGDVPLLGWLFKYKSKQKQKTNLLVFLTPHIIHNDGDMADIIKRKKGNLGLNEETGDFNPAITNEKPDGK